MTKLLILLLVFFPFGQLTKIPLGISEVSLYWQDLVISGLVGFWLIKKIKFSFARQPLAKLSPLTKPILLFIGAAGISLLANLYRLNQRELMVSGLYLLRWIVYAGVYFVIYDLTKFQSLKVSKFKRGLILAGSAAAVFGLIQYFLYPDLANLLYLGWDPHRFRVFGTFFDSGFLGIILVLTIVLILNNANGFIRRGLADRPIGLQGHAFETGGGKVAFKTISTILLFVICYVALALTYSRASYLAYFVGIGVFAWLKETPKLFLMAIVIGVVTIMFLPRPSGSEAVRLQREETVWGRVRNWQESLTIFKDQPLFGVGFNAYRYAQEDYGFLKEKESHAGAGADSSLFFVLATTGFLGFFAYLYLIYHILIYDIRRGNYIVVASLAAVIVHSFFSNTLFYPWVMIWLWVLLGITNTDPETSSG